MEVDSIDNVWILTWEGLSKIVNGVWLATDPKTPDKSENSGFKIWPNPASDILNVTADRLFGNSARFELIQTNGATNCYFPLLFDKTEQTISLKNVKPGVYFCKIRNSKISTQAKKLVIIK